MNNTTINRYNLVPTTFFSKSAVSYPFMGQFKFVSNRSVKNEKGEETGKIKIFVKSDSNTAEGDYKCPECLNEGKINQEFSRPFFVICQKCNFKINLPKLKERYSFVLKSVAL